MQPLRTATAPLVEALDLLARLEALATLYAARTPRVIEVGTALSRALSTLAGREPTVVLRIGPEGVSANAERLSLDEPVARTLVGRLHRLGLVGLEIDVAASVGDLHALAAALRTTARRVELSNGLVSVEFTALPPTVRVLHREFGRRDVVLTQAVTRALDSVDEVLRTSSVEPAARAACEDWIGRALQRLVERIELPESVECDPAATARGLDAALTTACSALTDALAAALGAQADHADFAALCSALEEALARSSDAESVRSLTQMLRESKHEALDAQASAEATRRECELDELPDDGAGYEHSLEELRARVGECLSAAGRPGDVPLESRRERIAIFVDLLFDHSSDRLVPEILQRLHEAIGPRLTTAEVAMFGRALLEFLERADPWMIDLRLPAVAAVLGAERAALWLNVACQVADSKGPERALALAPHLAGELLDFSPALHAGLRRRVIAAVAALPRAELAAVVRRLPCTRAVYESRIGPRSFQSLRPELAGFYRALFDSALAHTLRPHLLAGLKAHPPGWAGAQALVAVEQLDTRSSRLVAAILEGGLGGTASPELQLELARYLTDRLRRAPEDERKAPWVVPAIDALGQLGLEEFAPDLERITAERRKLVLHAWPAGARRAARQALDRMRTEDR